MRKRKGLLPLLLLGSLSLIGLVFYVVFIDPTKSFQAANIHFSPIIFFFILLLAAVSCFGSYLFMNIRRGILLGVFVMFILVLRFFGFTSYLYIGILLIITLLIELGFHKR